MNANRVLNARVLPWEQRFRLLWGRLKRESLFSYHRRSPRKTALPPSSSSILSNWLYFANLSDRAGAPVFNCPAFVATATSARKESSVSPDRWENKQVWPVFLAVSTVSSVSVSVPICLT